jgi:signal transduction histidine kinase
VLVETDERRSWRQYVRDALRPETETETGPLPRGAFIADTALAVLLTVLAVIAAVGLQHGDHFLGQGAPVAPTAPLPLPPGAAPPAASTISNGVSFTTSLPLAVLASLPLMARRRYPLAVSCIVMGAVVVLHQGATWITALTCVIASYGAVAHSRYRVQATAALPLAALLVAVAFRHTDARLPASFGPFIVVLAGGFLASFIRFWKQRLKASQDELAELHRAQEAATRLAIEQERSRITSELHDVVTHNVSVMVIQAGAARKVLDMAPEQTREALVAIEASGRAAMTELRHVMGLLATTSDSDRLGNPGDELEPQPGLEQLDFLIERVRAAGVTVNTKVSPPPEPLSPGLDLTAYRVVQEALTNIIKHAVGATATVAIDHTDGWLDIEVTDTGGTQVPHAHAGTGRGLIGLRERLAVYDGTLQAERTIGGGYRVRARAPRRTP